ncbi:MAG: hypothetical protein ACK56I_22260 [bacterium]
MLPPVLAVAVESPALTITSAPTLEPDTPERISIDPAVPALESPDDNTTLPLDTELDPDDIDTAPL